MKIIFLENVPYNEIGVKNKIKYQVKAFRNKGFLVDYYSKSSLNINLEKLEKKKIIYFNIIKGKLIRKLSSILFLLKMRKKEMYKDVLFIYIRSLGAYPWTIGYYKFLKKLRVKIILEIPSYPYDRENNPKKFFVKMDKRYRLRLWNYIDKIVTYSDDKEIWGIPCINISNGIDLESVRMINKKNKKEDKIVFTSVSNCSFWHGIDRFLNSLVKYKENGGKEKILFNIVGEGIETLNLKKIVKENPIIKDMVVFHGFKLGEDLEEIYNQTDIGVASLGFFRTKMEKGSTLKVREYCAKGIPFIIGYEDTSLKNGTMFKYKVSNDSSLFCIKDIIFWYKNLNVSSFQIRKYAEENLSWDIQMKEVIDNI